MSTGNDKEFNLDQQKAIEVFNNIAKTLKNDSILHLHNDVLGEINFPSGILGDLERSESGGYGMKHIIQRRYEEDIFNVDEIASVLYLVKDIAEHETEFIWENNSRGKLERNGIQVVISKNMFGDQGNQWIITGYGIKDSNNEIKKEVTDATQTVIAQYGYALEHSSIREQVGAVIASVDNIRQEQGYVKKETLPEHIVQKRHVHTSEQYAELLENGTDNITKSPQDWVNFLQFAANNYKLHSNDIIVLHEAFPDGVTFGTHKDFQRYGRKVARYEKGITIPARMPNGEMIIKNDGYYAHKKVFDLSQTEIDFRKQNALSTDDTILIEKLWHLTVPENKQTEACLKMVEACVNYRERETQNSGYDITDSSRSFIERSAYVIAAAKTGLWGNGTIQDEIAFFSDYFDDNSEYKIDFQETFGDPKTMLDVIISVARNTINDLEQQYPKEKGVIEYDRESGKNYLRQPSGSLGERDRLQSYAGGMPERREVRRNENEMDARAEAASGRRSPGNDRAAEQGTGDVQRNSSRRDGQDLAAAYERGQSERSGSRPLFGESRLDGNAQSESGRNNGTGTDIHEVTGDNPSSLSSNVAYRSVYQALSEDHRNVKDWYATHFLNDSIVERLNENVTFSQVWTELCNKKDVDVILGDIIPDDRQRIFVEMASTAGTSFASIYDIYIAQTQEEIHRHIEALKQIEAREQEPVPMQTTGDWYMANRDAIEGNKKTQQPTEDLTPEERKRANDLLAQAEKAIEMAEKEGGLVYGIDVNGKIIRGSELFDFVDEDRAEQVEDAEGYIRNIVGVVNSGENITFEPDITPTNHANQNSQGFVFNYEKYYADAFPANMTDKIDIKDRVRLSNELVYGNRVYDKKSAEEYKNFAIDENLIKSLTVNEQAYLILEACQLSSNDFSSYPFNKVPRSERLNTFLNLIWQDTEKANAVTKRVFATVLDGRHEGNAYNLFKSDFIKYPVIKEQYGDYITELYAHFVDDKVSEDVINYVIQDLIKDSRVGNLIYKIDGSVETDFFLSENSQKSIEALKHALGQSGVGSLALYPDGYFGHTGYDTYRNGNKLTIERGEVGAYDKAVITYPQLIKRIKMLVEPEKAVKQVKIKNARVISHDNGYQQLSLFDFVDEEKEQSTVPTAVSTEKSQSYYAVSGVCMRLGNMTNGEVTMFIRDGEKAEAENRIDTLPKSVIGFNKQTLNEEFYFNEKADAERFAALVRKYHNNTEFGKAWNTARHSSISFADNQKLFDVFGRFVDIEQTTEQDIATGQDIELAATRHYAQTKTMKELESKFAQSWRSAVVTHAFVYEDWEGYLINNSHERMWKYVKPWIEAVKANPAYDILEKMKRGHRIDGIRNYMINHYDYSPEILAFSIYACVPKGIDEINTERLSEYGIPVTAETRAMLNGLSVNYPELIQRDATHNLDYIRLPLNGNTIRQDLIDSLKKKIQQPRQAVTQQPAEITEQQEEEQPITEEHKQETRNEEEVRSVADTEIDAAIKRYQENFGLCDAEAEKIKGSIVSKWGTDKYGYGKTVQEAFVYLGTARTADIPLTLSADDVVIAVAQHIATIEQEHGVLDNIDGVSFIEAEKKRVTELQEELRQQEQQPTEEKTAAQQPTAHELINYKITEQEYRTFPEKERFRNNIEAIQLLKQIENEKRLATADEQQVLSRYVGWGGLSAAFDNRNEKWSNEYKQLQEVLTEPEYNAARASTVTAFYTPQVVTEAIYDALDNFGFEKGNILEPAAGIGNFFGALPEKMSDSRLYGVEMDSISGRIAKQLYQKADIKISPYQQAEYPDNFFDVSISNVPFAQIKPYDPKYNRNNFFVHDYYFAKTLDKVRPGGVIAFVTSTGTMDKEKTEVRKYIAQRAELLGAIRLPNTTFKGIANTSASSDIIFLQKREYIEAEPKADWIYRSSTTQNGEEYSINSYFVEHPEMILGKLAKSGMYGGEQTICEAIPDIDLKQQLASAIQNIKGEIIRNAAAEFEATEETKAAGIKEDEGIPAETSVKDNSLTIFEGELYERKGSMMYKKHSESPAVQKRMYAYAQMTKTLCDLVEYESTNAPDIQIEATRKELNKYYSEFTEEYGLINSRKNCQLFKNDTNFSLMTAVEELDEDGKLKRLAPIMTERTISPYIVPSRAATSVEALTISLQQRGQVDFEYICGLIEKEQKDVLTDLKGLIYKDYEATAENSGNDIYVVAEEYLSGEVHKKLQWLENPANAENIRNENGGQLPEDYSDNIRALREAQPKKLEAKDIKVSLGANWVPAQYYVDFTRELLDFKEGTWYSDQLEIKTVTKTVKDPIGDTKEIEEWEVNLAKRHFYTHNELLNKIYGVDGVDNAHALRLIQDCMNSKSTKIEIKDNPKKSVEKTLEAQLRQRKIENKFREWIFKDEKRRNALVELYNEKFNSTVARKYDGSHLNFPGMSLEWKEAFRDFQKDAVARVLYGGNTLFAHCVGAGKTFEMVASAMESKRLGHCNKPMIVVPNHLVVQTASEFMRLYPGANIIVPNSSNDLTKQNRRKFVARIATNNCDAVIVPHSFFNKMKMSADYCRKFTDAEKERLREQKERNEGRGASVKNIEAAIERLDDYISRLEENAKRDINIEFDKLGVDMLFVDEAHEYKNLHFTSNIEAKGLGNQQGSSRAWDMNMKVQWINQKSNYKGVVFATGTPVSNSLSELWTMQRYLRPDRLKELGFESFDRWAKTFAMVESNMELDVTGSGLRTADRLSKFFNMPELMNIVWEFADIKTTEQLQLPVPEATFDDIIQQPTPTQERMIIELQKRCEYVRQHPREEEVIQSGGMLGVTNIGRKIAIDQRYYEPDTPDDPDSKLDTVAKNVAKIYKNTEKERLTQVIFCDLSTPHPKSRKNDNEIFNIEFCAYDDIKKKLVSYGVKPEEIAFIHDAEAKSDPARAKQEIFNKMQQGTLRVLLGSTQKLGVGANIQRKLIALHNVDCPWRPLDFTQRLGRIIRQGNENESVNIFNYGVERTFDAYMYNVVAAKQKFAGQIMTGQIKDRECDDLGEQEMNFAQMSACLSGDPRILQQANLKKQVKELEDERNYFYNDIYAAQDKLNNVYPKTKEVRERRIAEWTKISEVAEAATVANTVETQQQIKIFADEIANAKESNITDDELKALREKRNKLKKLENSTFTPMYFEDKGIVVNDRGKANDLLSEAIQKLDHDIFDKDVKMTRIGKYRGLDFDIYYHFGSNTPMAAFSVNGGMPYEIQISGLDGADNIRKIDHYLNRVNETISIEQIDLDEINRNIERCKKIVTQTFDKQEELDRKTEELIKLNQELDVSKNKSVIDTEAEEKTNTRERAGIRAGQPHDEEPVLDTNFIKEETKMAETKHEVLDFFDSLAGDNSLEPNWSSRFSKQEVHMLYKLAVSEYIEDLKNIYNSGNDLSHVAALEVNFDVVSDISRELKYVKNDITVDENVVCETLGKTFWEAPTKYGTEIAPEDVVKNILNTPVVQQFSGYRKYSDFEIFRDRFVGIDTNKQYSWEQEIQHPQQPVQENITGGKTIAAQTADGRTVVIAETRHIDLSGKNISQREEKEMALYEDRAVQPGIEKILTEAGYLKPDMGFAERLELFKQYDNNFTFDSGILSFSDDKYEVIEVNTATPDLEILSTTERGLNPEIEAMEEELKRIGALSTVDLNDPKIAQAATVALNNAGYIEAEKGTVFVRNYLDIQNNNNHFSFDDKKNVLTFSDDYWEKITVDCNTLDVIETQKAKVEINDTVAIDDPLANQSEENEKILKFAQDDVKSAQITVLETAGVISDNATEEDVERILDQELRTGHLRTQDSSVVYTTAEGKNFTTEIPNSGKSASVLSDSVDKVPEAINEVKNGDYQRLTEDIIPSSDIIVEGAKRYSSVAKGWLKNKVRSFEQTENGKTFWRTQMLLATKPPIGFKTEENGERVPEFQKGDENAKGTKFIFIEMDTKEKVDFSQFENAAKEISFSGQNCYVSKRNQEGKGTGEKTERFYARSAFVEVEYKGEIVRNQDNKPVYEFISPKENSMKNEVARAGREHERCHACKTKFDKWNDPVREAGKIVAYKHKFNAIYTPKIKGALKRDEDGNLVNNFKTFNITTPEPLTKAQIEKIYNSNVLSVNYLEHIHTFKDKENNWQKVHVCEATNVGNYLKRDKELEKDPLPERTYEGEVTDVTIDGFNTKDLNDKFVFHKFSDIDLSQRAKIVEGKNISLAYDKNCKVAEIKEVEKKTMEQKKSRHL